MAAAAERSPSPRGQGRGRREEPGGRESLGEFRIWSWKGQAAERAAAGAAGVGEGGGEPEEGEGGRGELWRRLRPAVCLSSPEEDEAEDWVHLTQFAGGGKLSRASGPLVFPVPAAGRPEPAEQDEGRQRCQPHA